MRFNGLVTVLSLLLALAAQQKLPSARISSKYSHSTVDNNDDVCSEDVLSDDNERPALLILQHRRCCSCQLSLVLTRLEEFAERDILTLRHIKLCRDKNQKLLAFESWMRGIFNVRIAILTVVCRVAESLDQLKKKKRITSTK